MSHKKFILSFLIIIGLMAIGGIALLALPLFADDHFVPRADTLRRDAALQPFLLDPQAEIEGIWAHRDSPIYVFRYKLSDDAGPTPLKDIATQVENEGWRVVAEGDDLIRLQRITSRRPGVRGARGSEECRLRHEKDRKTIAVAWARIEEETRPFEDTSAQEFAVKHVWPKINALGQTESKSAQR